MWILLIAGCLIPFVYLDRLMLKLDRNMNGGLFPVKSAELLPAAVVFGETDLAKSMVRFLCVREIPVFEAEEPVLLERGRNFGYVFALSDNDADNIVLCKIGSKIYCIDKIVGLCNDRENENMFIREKIRYLAGKEVTAQDLFDAVLTNR